MDKITSQVGVSELEACVKQFNMPFSTSSQVQGISLINKENHPVTHATKLTRDVSF